LGQTFRVLHFEHDGQPDFASRSRRFCERLCEENDVELEVEAIQGKKLASLGDLSWEAACRHLRYRSLKSKKGLFLTAHTADDQAETVVMRLLGGSGLAGLGGIYPTREEGVVRPLLTFSREELREYLREGERTWLEDPTNVDGNARALIRSAIMPTLLAHQPALRSILNRTARRLREDEEYLRTATWNWMRTFGTEQGDNWPLKALQDMPRPLLIRFLQAASKALSGPGFRPRATLFEEAANLLHRGTNEAHVDFPGGWSLWILGERVWACPPLEAVEWEIGDLKEGEVFPGLEISRRIRPGWTAWAAPEGAVLRSRRPGDRYGGKSLKKLLAATGHPPWVRNRWPMLVKGKSVLKVFGRPGRDDAAEEPNIWVNFRPTLLRACVKPPEK
jgi:tRNA(Ile)-lysidine synthetase-like protein